MSREALSLSLSLSASAKISATEEAQMFKVIVIIFPKKVIPGNG